MTLDAGHPLLESLRQVCPDCGAETWQHAVVRGRLRCTLKADKTGQRWRSQLGLRAAAAVRAWRDERRRELFEQPEMFPDAR